MIENRYQDPNRTHPPPWFAREHTAQEDKDSTDHYKLLDRISAARKKNLPEIKDDEE